MCKSPVNRQDDIVINYYYFSGWMFTSDSDIFLFGFLVQG